MMKPIQLLLLFCIAVVISSCGVDILTCETSQDGKMEACAYTKRIGDHNTYVGLKEKQSGKEIKIMKIKNVSPVAFRWIGSTELNVNVQYQDQVEYLNQGAMGVKIDVIQQK